MITVLNMNSHQVSVKLVTAKGVDYVTLMPGKKVKLPTGTEVDANWKATQPRVIVKSDVVVEAEVPEAKPASAPVPIPVTKITAPVPPASSATPPVASPTPSTDKA